LNKLHLDDIDVFDEVGGNVGRWKEEDAILG
jgi:hypothetical protein